MCERIMDFDFIHLLGRVRANEVTVSLKWKVVAAEESLGLGKLGTQAEKYRRPKKECLLIMRKYRLASCGRAH